MTTVNVYLNFNGNCEEVFNFYKSVFGGEFASVMRFKEMPSDTPMPENVGEKILHVSLPIGQGTILMGADRPESMGEVIPGNNFTIAIGPDSEEQANNLFNGLSAGGTVTMPLAKAFWGAYFGMFKDKFGIDWMVNYEEKK
jgi:PhnB protein